MGVLTLDERLQLDALTAEASRRTSSRFMTFFSDTGPCARSGYPKHLDFFAAGHTEGADQTIIRSKEAMEQVQRRIAAAIANGEQVWLDIVTPRVTTSETFDLASADATGFPS